MHEDLVLRHDAAGVATLTLQQGERYNTLSEQMMAALQAHLLALASDEQIRVVVLASTGKAFCAGHDLQQMQTQPEETYYRSLFAQCSMLMLTLQKLPQPVIASVQGIATAAGCQLVAMCDLAVASEQARFAVSGVKLGLFCATPAVALSRNIGRKAALEMLLTGDFIDAQTALERGLINQVVAHAELPDAVAALAAKLVAKPREAISMGKQLFYKQLEMGMAAAYQLAGTTMAGNLVHDSAQEGVNAFLEKRAPNWD